MRKKIGTMVLAMGIFFGTPMRAEAVVTPENLIPDQSVQIAITYSCEQTVGDEPVYLHYVVTGEDETLDSISLRFALGEDYIHCVNPEYEKGFVFAPGSTVALPLGIYWPDVQEGVYYNISAGDTLTEISGYFDTTISELMKLNPEIKNSDIIYEGDIVRVI